MSHEGTTALDRQIRSQPAALEHMLSSPAVREQVHLATEGLHRARRLWVVGTGTSLHAAELGAAMLVEAGRTATVVPAMQFVTQAPVIGPKDGVIVITHTGETSYALAVRALAVMAGLDTVTITKRGSDFPRAIETVEAESSETYTASYTTALVALALIARELGADSMTDDVLASIPEAVQGAIDDPGVGSIPRPDRALVITGGGPASVTAREGALKIREAARVLAEGYDVEYLLHGSAVPLDHRDHLVTLTPPDEPLVAGVGTAAQAEGLGHTSVNEPSSLPPLLAQIPLTVRLQLLALRMAQEGGHDPDRVIVGAWADEALWRTGAPEE
ncbi:MAG: SIS domain-containing protein [Actinomycetota bacterium]|nr:SIS domain-containing protein [Actinomycetota bacterium]MDH5223243.1 SIS domain-containing protein [Actinomycetota bacterium]MDH5312513.1 SIS domain-containing protein [Actinomycetota bacterium]